MKAIFKSNSGTARLAAGLFFFVCWPTARLGTGYSHSNLLLPKDAAATASNMLSNEFIFRSAIIGHLVSVIAFLAMALLFYRLFGTMDKHLLRMMIIPPFLQLVIVFILELFCFAALMILKGEVLITIDESLKNEFVYMALRVHVYGSRFFQMFLGLWLVSLGMLIYRSGFAPRIIAILTMIGGVVFVAEGCFFILLQRPDYLMVIKYLKFTFVIAFSAILWFLIMGVREKREFV